jgi:hypothetical protein
MSQGSLLTVISCVNVEASLKNAGILSRICADTEFFSKHQDPASRSVSRLLLVFVRLANGAITAWHDIGVTMRALAMAMYPDQLLWLSTGKASCNGSSTLASTVRLP